MQLKFEYFHQCQVLRFGLIYNAQRILNRNVWGQKISNIIIVVHVLLLQVHRGVNVYVLLEVLHLWLLTYFRVLSFENIQDGLNSKELLHHQFLLLVKRYMLINHAIYQF